MSFVPVRGERYDMPVVFGPSPVPDRTVITDAHSIVLSFATSRAAAAVMVPSHFSLPEVVTASVSYVSYKDVDYLGGRGYNEVVISLSALHEGKVGTMAAGLAPVLWVNKVGALVAGREYMGLPKLFGTIPDAVVSETEASFACYEEDALLLRGAARDLQPLNPEKLQRVNERAGEVSTFGWKYIAGPDGPDADYPLVNVMRWDYREAWTGQGSLEFFPVDRSAAPFAAPVMKVLSTLPVEGPVRAFRGVGTATIDRTATRRLA